MPPTLQHTARDNQPLPWQDPLACAATVSGEDMCFLHSSLNDPETGRYSYLCVTPQEHIEGDSLSALERIRKGEQWFGHLSYELAHKIEQLPPTSASAIPTPKLRFVRYRDVYCFDHKTRRIFATNGAPPLTATQHISELPHISSLQSNMSKQRYLQSVAATKEQILAGAFYQANITRKFFGAWEGGDPFSIFVKLCEASPAPYSAFIRDGEQCIISSSPEQFLRANNQGILTSRPIKGTSPAELSASALYGSAKDRAENLMIVDLMRNDFSRVCEQGSVSVDALYAIKSYQTLHHMVSTITGRLQGNISTTDILHATFPPGSMTGAPKVAAMQWCAQQEQQDRGVYSGAIGRICGDGTIDLSVTIRTILCERDRFEFQVGGGIVADSTPHAEWEETLTKARGICAALGIDIAELTHL